MEEASAKGGGEQVWLKQCPPRDDFFDRTLI